jgi:N-acetyl sugar amidotransferase
MDTTDPDITFYGNGCCNHCLSFPLRVGSRTFKGEEAKQKLENLISSIKKTGKSKEYDCIIGVSGGVDSTYVAYLVKTLGLKPLAIHFDNGWNSELAVSNIEKVLKKLNIDLYTYVIDWPEFRDLQMSFLKASTPDGEIPTDHAINALLFHEANKRNIKYIINGMNFATESLSVPGWAYGHSDWKYIRDVHSRFGKVKLRNYPHYNFLYLFYLTFIRGIKTASILNYIDYNKDQAMELLQKELGWVYYGGKHYESVYTRFFQSYILPQKFNIDKRRGHLSDLIHSGQMTRMTALDEIKKEICPAQMLDNDKEFVIKKFGLTLTEFDDIMKSPIHSFKDYKNNFELVKKIKRFVNLLRNRGLYTK